MKTSKTSLVVISLVVLMSLTLVTGCTSTNTTYVPVYTGPYVAPVAVQTTDVPRLDYVGFDANWYGGTPDYFNTSLILND